MDSAINSEDGRCRDCFKRFHPVVNPVADEGDELDRGICNVCSLAYKLLTLARCRIVAPPKKQWSRQLLAAADRYAKAYDDRAVTSADMLMAGREPAK